MKKNYFFGKYYKFISLDGFSFAVIISTANEGDKIQLITQKKSYQVDDTNSIKVNGNEITFNVNQEDLIIKGSITLGELHPLKRRVMGPFSFIPFMQCRHNIYSMFHDLSGSISINNESHSFNNGYGYIEGDEGRSFPSRYIWYNSVKKDHGVTMAIATIPFGLIKFIGILCFIKSKDKEYYLSTYNLVKAKKISEEEIILKKRDYEFILKITPKEGHKLKAPVLGNMDRYIKENLVISTSYIFKKKDKIILKDKDELSSLEYMFD